MVDLAGVARARRGFQTKVVLSKPPFSKKPSIKGGGALPIHIDFLKKAPKGQNFCLAKAGSFSKTGSEMDWGERLGVRVGYIRKV